LVRLAEFVVHYGPRCFQFRHLPVGSDDCAVEILSRPLDKLIEPL